MLQCAGEGLRRDVAGGKDFAGEVDDDRIGLGEPGGVASPADGIDKFRRDALGQRGGLVGGPFELAVVLARGRQYGQFAHPAAKPRLVAQVVVDRPRTARQLGAVQLDAARPL